MKHLDQRLSKEQRADACMKEAATESRQVLFLLISKEMLWVMPKTENPETKIRGGWL